MVYCKHIITLRQMGTHTAVYPEREAIPSESWCLLGPHTDTL